MPEIAPSSSLKYARAAGFIAIFGALIGCLGDTLLLYHPSGFYLDTDYASLAEIGSRRLLWGHYLGILAIPLEAGGIYLIYLALQKSGQKLALGAGILGLYLMFCGVAYHGTIYPMADAFERGPEAVGAMKVFGEPLGMAFAGVFMLLMLGMAVMILQGKTHLKRWTVLASPIVTYPIWTVLAFAIPSVGNFLMPMGFNLSMAIFFGAMMISGRVQREV
jgi:hypothetical protein